MATLAAGGRAGNARVAWIVVLIALSVLLNYVDRGAIGVAAPLMKSELGLSATGFGVAVSAFFWVYASMCLVVGWLCDRFCVYRMFAAGVAIWALSTALTGFIGGIAALIVLRLFLGLGESIAFPGASKVFAAELPAHHRGLANAMVAAAIAFGPAVGSLAGGSILGGYGWRPIFWIFGGVTLLWLLPWWIASGPLRAGRSAAPAAAPPPFAPLLRVPTLWLMGALHALMNYGFYFIVTWAPLYLVNTRGFSIPEMTLVTTLGFTVQGVSALLFGRLSDMAVARGWAEGQLRRRLIIFGQICLGAGIAGIAFDPPLVGLAFCLVLAGLGTGFLSTNVFAVGQIFAGPRRAGGWIGLQNAVGNVSGIVGPIITGLIIDHFGGYIYALATAAGLSWLGALLWWKAVPTIRQLDI
ncbi:MAG: MFS transporter [Sphingobium sp.]|nr:MFS transporter [Sphingobium sp.]